MSRGSTMTLYWETKWWEKTRITIKFVSNSRSFTHFQRDDEIRLNINVYMKNCHNVFIINCFCNCLLAFDSIKMSSAKFELSENSSNILLLDTDDEDKIDDVKIAISLSVRWRKCQIEKINYSIVVLLPICLQLSTSRFLNYVTNELPHTKTHINYFTHHFY